MTKKHFSLVELILTMAVLSILLTLLQPSLQQMMKSSHRLGCSNNLRIHGSAIDLYADDFDDAVCMTFWPGTATMQTIFHPAVFRDGRLRANRQGQFHDGTVGYLEPYIGDNSTTYHCPSAYYPQGLKNFSVEGLFVRRISTYSGFTSFNSMVKNNDTLRKRHDFYMINRAVDANQGWDEKNLKVYLMDSVVNLGAWVRTGGLWDLSGAIIHSNSEPLPILMSDGHVLQLDRTTNLINPSFRGIINAVYDAL